MAKEPSLPIPISVITGRYMLFDINAVSYLRREHRICGVLIGSIPQSPSQNVFLGLPLELMPEEAQLLVSKGVAYIANDVRAHDEILHKVDLQKRQQYLASTKQDGERAARAQKTRKQQSKSQALRQQTSSSSTPLSEATITSDVAQSSTGGGAITENVEDDSLFSAPETTARTRSRSGSLTPYGVTPATSQSLLPTPPTTPSASALEVPATYPLFKHLHDRGYFLSPGLRFGCQYMAYPGDPLRYHSHFLVVGNKWEEEIDLMEIVGGGRLGTGVKKGYLLGGADPEGEVKTFSVEWAAM